MESANKGVTLVKIICLPLLVIAIVILNQIHIVECAFISSIQAQTYNTSDGKLCYKCSPGQHWVADCTRAGEVARCQPCANGSFQTVENVALTCQQCTNYCLQQHQDLITACNSTTDNICQCESGYYKSDIEGVCIKHRMCASGQFVKSPGNKDRDTICESCIAGHNFSTNESSTESCLPCTKCNVNGLVEITQCTITSDAKCEASGGSHIIGAILGGTLGSLVIIIIIVIIVLYIRRHQQRVPNPEESFFSTESTHLNGISPYPDQEESTAKVHENQVNGSRNDAVQHARQLETPSSSENSNQYSSRHKDSKLNLRELSKDLLNTPWKFFFRELSVDESSIKQVELDHNNDVQEQIYQLLIKVTQIGNLSKTNLIKALKQIERNDLAEKYSEKEEFPESVSGENNH